MDVAVVRGELDDAYLAAALARAGRPGPGGPLQARELGDGRSGAVVTALTAGGQSFVHKAIRLDSPRGQAVGDQGRTEAALWTAGVTRDLPAPLCCPTFDATHHVERGEWWILMDDVSAGIVPRGQFVEARARELLTAVARLHARYWGRAEVLPLASPEIFARAVCGVNATLAQGEKPTGWGARWVDSFVVMRDCMPVFIELLEPGQADFYAELCAQPSPWLAALARHPRTFIHGDLRRANMSFQDGRVALFDWDLAAVGHPSLDLQWWWLLQFWAYPPADGKSVDDREALRQHYLGALEAALGPVNRADFEVAWRLGWLRNLAELGYIIADPLTDPGASPELRERVRATARRAVAWARQICDDHV